MLIISCQYQVSGVILHRKLREGKARKVAVNLVTPHIGIVVDGHHDYWASRIDHKPLTIVTASMDVSEGLTGAGLLDFWDKQKDIFDRIEGTWQFYELFTGKPVPVKLLKEAVDHYPDYRYSV